MSKCISSHGEYSEHTVTDSPFICDWCGTFDEDAAIAEVDRLRAHAQKLAAGLALVLYDAHPSFGSTAKWGGGIGGQAITSHCSITQGAAPGTEWAEFDLPSKPLREFLNDYPFDLDACKRSLRDELQAMLAPARR